MNFDKTSNPTLGQDIINRYAYAATDRTMTVQGTIKKIFALLLLVIGAAAFTWSKVNMSFELGEPSVRGWMIGGSIAGFVLAIVITVKKELATFLSPIYAICEGLFIGAISAYFEMMFPGIIMRAVLLTFSVFFGMIFLFRIKLIRATQRFRSIILAATAGIALAYLVTFIVGLFGVNMAFMYNGGTLGIVISLIIVAIAALNLILDFDFIEKGAECGLPAYFEWYGAFGLMVTIVWLYVEILRLLVKIFGSRD